MGEVTQAEAIHALMGITSRTVGLLSWMLFALVHTAVITAFLFAAWVGRLDPERFAGLLLNLVPPSLASSAPAALSFLGISGAAVLIAYAKGWQWLLRKLASAYVWKHI